MTVNSTDDPTYFNLTSSSSGPGFFAMENPAGNEFAATVQSGSLTGFDVSEDSIFIVTANVQVNSVNSGAYDSSAGSTGIASAESFGMLALGFRSTGTSVSYIVPDAVVYINSFNTTGYDSSVSSPSAKSARDDWDKTAPSEQNVSLFHVFTSSELSTITGGNNIYKFQVFASTMNRLRPYHSPEI